MPRRKTQPAPPSQQRQQQYFQGEDDEDEETVNGSREIRNSNDVAELLHDHLRLAMPSKERQRQLDSMPCPCQGKFSDRRHGLYMGCLHYDNDEYRIQDGAVVPEQSFVSYRLLPLNYLGTVLSGSPIYHVQFFYWDEAKQTYISISVDTYHNCVHEYDKKTFRRGWTFFRLLLPKWQENGIVQFLRAQIGKPMNLLGSVMLYFMPVSGRGESYFCSELCVAAFHSVGLFLHTLPGASSSPPDVYNAIKNSGEVEYIESEHPLALQRNREYWRQEEERQRSVVARTKERRLVTRKDGGDTDDEADAFSL